MASSLPVAPRLSKLLVGVWYTCEWEGFIQAGYRAWLVEEGFLCTCTVIIHVFPHDLSLNYPN